MRLIFIWLGAGMMAWGIASVIAMLYPSFVHNGRNRFHLMGYIYLVICGLVVVLREFLQQ